MYFQTRILFVSFAATVILAIFIIPILRKFKIGQIERDDGPESHLGKKGTPTMGGIIIAAGIIIGTIGGYIYYSKTDPEVGKPMRRGDVRRAYINRLWTYWLYRRL